MVGGIGDATQSDIPRLTALQIGLRLQIGPRNSDIDECSISEIICSLSVDSADISVIASPTNVAVDIDCQFLGVF